MKTPAITRHLLLAAATIVAASVAHADIVTKSDSGTDLTLGTSWGGGIAPTSADVATWDSNSLGAGLTIGASTVNWGGINITGTTSATVNIAGTGTINTGNISLSTTGSKTLTVGANIGLTGNSIFDIADATGSTANDASLNGVISGTGYSVTKTGMGSLTLTGLNTYTGGTVVNEGILALGAGSGPTGVIRGALIINSGAEVQLAGNWSLGYTTCVTSITINGGTLNKTSAPAGTGSGASTINMTGGLIKGVSVFDLFTGAGALSFNTYASADTATVSVATRLRAANKSTIFTVADGAAATDLLVSGNISEDGALAPQTITKSGAGTMVLSGTNSFTGSTTVNGGTLALDYSTLNTNKIASGAALILGGGTLSVLGNGSAATTQTVLSTALNAGSSTASVTKNASTHNATLNLNAITRNVGGTLNVVTAGTGTGTASVTTDTLNDATGILGAWATVGGADWAKNSTGAADGAITAYTGYTTDTWGAGNHTDVSLAGADPASDSTTASLRFNAAGAKSLNLTGANTLSSGGILVTGNVGANATTITGGTLAGSASGDLIVQQHNIAGTLSIASVIADNGGATALTKAGPGTLILSGTNTYTGKTYLGGGITQISADNNLGTAPGAATAGQLTLNGATLQFGAGFNLATNRGIALGGGGGTFDTNGFNTSYAGIIAGAGSLTKAGNGTLTLSGANTYTGGTVVNGGALTLTGTGRIRGDLTINAGATVNADGWSLGYDSNYVDAININGGTLHKTGGGGTNAHTLNMTGGSITADASGFDFYNVAATSAQDIAFNTHASATTATVAARMNLRMNNATSTGGTMTFTVADGAAATDLLISGNITVAGTASTQRLVKTGAGTMRITGSNTVAGGFTISGGTLDAGSATALGAGYVTVNGGTLATSVTSVTGIGNLTLNNASVLNLNGTAAGTITLTNASNFAMSAGTWSIDLVNGTDAIMRLAGGAGTFSITGGTLDLGDGLINYGNTYNLITGFSSGSVSGLSITGYDNTNWSASLGTDGTLSFTAVPEPSTYGLIGAGLLAVAAGVRRRRKFAGTVA